MRLSAIEHHMGKSACATSQCAHARLVWQVRLSLNNDIKKVQQLALRETTLPVRVHLPDTRSSRRTFDWKSQRAGRSVSPSRPLLYAGDAWSFTGALG